MSSIGSKYGKKSCNSYPKLGYCQMNKELLKHSSISIGSSPSFGLHDIRRNLSIRLYSSLYHQSSSEVSDEIDQSDSRSTRATLLRRLRDRKSAVRSAIPSKSSVASNPSKSELKSPVSSGKSAPNNSSSGFGQLGLDVPIVSALDDLGFTTPTPVQRAIIPRLLRDESIVVAAATGSGKTLAFILPVIQQLLSQESEGYTRKVRRPRCLVLTPTRELADQIIEVVKQLSHRVKLSSCSVSGGESYSIQKRNLDRLIDIVVASPGRLLQHKLQGHVQLSHVSHIIIDEVDTMFTQGFGGEIRGILRSVLGKNQTDAANRIPHLKYPPQMIFATATLTKAVRSLMQDITGVAPDDEYSAFFDVDFPDPENLNARKLRMKEDNAHSNDDHKVPMKIVQVDGVHRGLTNIRYDYKEVPGAEDKLDTLVQILPSISSSKAVKGTKILVFCNTVASCRAVHFRLQEHFGLSKEETSREGISLYCYHGDMNSQQRKDHLDEFKSGIQLNDHSLNRRDPAIMVCTDIAARGIDIPDVDHVILFDFPLNPIDFLHRSGRTGRMGKKGLVTSLVTKRDLVLSNAIQAAMARGLPLESLSSSKRDYLDRGKLAPFVGRISKSDAIQRQKQKSLQLRKSTPFNQRNKSTKSENDKNTLIGRRGRQRNSFKDGGVPMKQSQSKTYVGRGVGREKSPVATTTTTKKRNVSYRK